MLEHGFLEYRFDILQAPYGEIGLGIVRDYVPVRGRRNGTS